MLSLTPVYSNFLAQSFYDARHTRTQHRITDTLMYTFLEIYVKPFHLISSILKVGGITKEEETRSSSLRTALSQILLRETPLATKRDSKTPKYSPILTQEAPSAWIFFFLKKKRKRKPKTHPNQEMRMNRPTSSTAWGSDTAWGWGHVPQSRTSRRTRAAWTYVSESSELESSWLCSAFHLLYLSMSSVR